MARRKTHEQFMKDFYKRNSNAENIEILEEYKGALTKIKCKCKIDNHIWEVTPHDLLSNNSGCPKCYGNIKKSHKEFIEELFKRNSNAENIEILGEYINIMTKIKCRCKIDGHEWTPIPNDLLNKNSGCPQCYDNARGNNQRKTHEQFMKDFYEKNSNAENIEVLGEYINAYTKIKCRCKIDNHIWEVVPNSLLGQDSGCPMCSSSKGEKAIIKYLEEHNIEFISQYRFEDCKFKQTLPFDFYISSLNIVIEFDGIQHFEIREYFDGFEGFIDRVIRDTIKTQYCKDHNIRLIRIPYWEFDNIEKILDEILN